MIIVRRGLAFLVDIFIGLIPWMIYGYFWGQKLPDGGYRIHLGVPGLLGVFVNFIPFYLYVILAEYFFGQTAGKWLFKLKVVRKDGGKLTAGDAVKRHLLDFVELILIPVIALISACADKSGRRIGDLWAGTLVVDKRMAEDGLTFS